MIAIFEDKIVKHLCVVFATYYETSIVCDKDIPTSTALCIWMCHSKTKGTSNECLKFHINTLKAKKSRKHGKMLVNS
jgi:hypothetical protein